MPAEYYSTLKGVVVDASILSDFVALRLPVTEPDESQLSSEEQADLEVLDDPAHLASQSIAWFLCLFSRSLEDIGVLLLIWDYVLLTQERAPEVLFRVAVGAVHKQRQFRGRVDAEVESRVTERDVREWMHRTV